MRKLTYEIFDKNGNFVKEVKTYNELEQEREKGNFFKDKLTEIHERPVFEIYAGKEKKEETSLLKKMLQAKKEGYIIKSAVRVY